MTENNTKPYKVLKNASGKTITYTEEEYKEVVRGARRLYNLDIGELLRAKHFFSTVLNDSELKWDTSIPYGAMSILTNNFVLYLNPINYVTLNKQSRRLFLLMHEIMHYIFKHPTAYRLYKKQQFQDSVKRMNYVTDLEINEQAADGYLTERIPGGLYVDEMNIKYGLNMEAKKDWHYYNGFYDKFAPENQEGGGGSGSGQPKEESGEGNGGSGQGEESMFDEAFVDEGSNKHPHEFWEQNEGQTEKTVVKNAIKKAYRTNGQDFSKNPGRYPAGLQKIVEEIIEDKTDYGQILRNISAKYLRGSAKRKYSKEHLFISQESEGYIAKGKSFKNKKRCLIVKDTSGSVGDKELKIINGHVSKLLKQGVEIWIMDVDADVHAFYQLNPRLGIKGQSKVLGGGGTSFCPPFEKIVAENLKFDVIIYLTDGYGSAPESFHIPTIWLIFEGGRVPTCVKTGKPIEWGYIIFSETK